jgi:hypothetical protein
MRLTMNVYVKSVSDSQADATDALAALPIGFLLY